MERLLGLGLYSKKKLQGGCVLKPIRGSRDDRGIRDNVRPRSFRKRQCYGGPTKLSPLISGLTLSMRQNGKSGRHPGLAVNVGWTLVMAHALHSREEFHYQTGGDPGLKNWLPPLAVSLLENILVIHSSHHELISTDPDMPGHIFHREAPRRVPPRAANFCACGCCKR